MQIKRCHVIREQDRIVKDLPITDTLKAKFRPRNFYKSKYRSKEFDSASYNKSSENIFTINNCQGSLILVDSQRTGINKLHIGQLLIRNPHAELYGSKGEGPRIDLNRIDVKYARERLIELEKWRDPKHREKLNLRYDKLGWYSVPHRLNQLDISRQGLEIKINLMKELVSYLDSKKENTFVSDTALEIEKRSNKLMRILENAALSFGEIINKRDERFQKIVICSDIINRTEKISSLVNSILNFAEQHENFKFDRARDYWPNVDSWGECRIGDYIFTRYESDFFTHLKRHFPKGKTIGSTFNNYFPSPRAVIDFAWEKIQTKGYNGKNTIIELDLPEPIGLEGVMALSDLPTGAEVKEDIRDKKHKVNVVSGIEKKPTNHLVIIIGPLKTGRDGFTSIYPGQFCPDIDKDPGFWDKHAFIE